MDHSEYSALPARSFDSRCEEWVAMASQGKIESGASDLTAWTSETYDRLLSRCFFQFIGHFERQPLHQDIVLGLVMNGLVRGFQVDVRFLKLAQAIATRLAQKVIYLDVFPDPTQRREALLQEALCLSENLQTPAPAALEAPLAKILGERSAIALDYVSMRFADDLARFYEKKVPKKVYFTHEQLAPYRAVGEAGKLPQPLYFWTQLFVESLGFRAAFFYDQGNSEILSDRSEFLIFASDSSNGKLKTPLWFLECIPEWSEASILEFSRFFKSALAIWSLKYRAMFGPDALHRLYEGMVKNPYLHDTDRADLPNWVMERYQENVRQLWENSVQDSGYAKMTSLRGMISHEASSVSFEVIQGLVGDEAEDLNASLLNETLDFFLAENQTKIKQIPEIAERYLGSILYGLELELAVDNRHLREAIGISDWLRVQGGYLAEWDDAELRAQALQLEERVFRDSLSQ